MKTWEADKRARLRKPECLRQIGQAGSECTSQKARRINRRRKPRIKQRGLCQDLCRQMFGCGQTPQKATSAQGREHPETVLARNRQPVIAPQFCPACLKNTQIGKGTGQWQMVTDRCPDALLERLPVFDAFASLAPEPTTLAPSQAILAPARAIEHLAIGQGDLVPFTLHSDHHRIRDTWPLTQGTRPLPELPSGGMEPWLAIDRWR